MTQHALLSPSASHRWLNCTPSARLESVVENTGSDFTREGSLAHAYCAKALKTFLGQSVRGEDIEIEELFTDYYSTEMDEHVDSYVSIVLDKYNTARQHTADAILAVETRLDFTDWVPESFGTADAIIIADDMMEVIDFKYGKGVEVSATDNTQMMIYALGAVAKYSDEYAIKRVRMTIVQPRISNLSEFEMPVNDLLDWAETELKPKAKAAMSGKGEQKAGKWCRFCRVKCQCKALAKYCSEDFKQQKENGQLMSLDEIADLLPKIADIKNWADSVADYALQKALEGETIKGFKLVEGRSVRKILDEEKAAAILQGEGFDDIYKPKELRTITDLEKIVGKKAFPTLMGELLIKPQGKPTLVPESDKRPALNSASTDFDNFD